MTGETAEDLIDRATAGCFDVGPELSVDYRIGPDDRLGTYEVTVESRGLVTYGRFSEVDLSDRYERWLADRVLEVVRRHWWRLAGERGGYC